MSSPPPPRTIAIVGASANPEKFGNKAVRAYRQRGWTVVPVNPKEAAIEGIAAYRTLAEVPVPVDEVSLYLPPAAVPAVLREIAAKGVKRVWLNPGTESEAALALAEELGLEAIVACSIVGVGVNPGTL